MYIFYDTEATGLDTDFTQLLQVALVFADDDLNVLASKKSECRRTPWTIPSPGAMLITGFTPDDLKNAKLTHYDMMRDIVAWTQSQHWPVTFVGYNSLGFDEPALERNLAVNLLPRDMTTAPSPHNDGRNRRFDVFPLVKLVAALRPGLLTLETLNEYGKPSMSLINVAQQNGVQLSAEDAHDAMNDIRATLGVAKVIMDRAGDIWTHALENLSSPAALAAYVAKTPVVAYTDLSYGRNVSIAASDVGASTDGLRRVVFDLSVDPAQYLGLSAAELAKLMRQTFDRNYNGPALPFRLVQADMQPNVLPVDMAEDKIKNYDPKTAAARAAQLMDADFRARVQEAADLVQKGRGDFNKNARPPMLEQMFDRPVDPAVAPRLEKWIEDFHAATDWQARALMARNFASDFAADIARDPALKRIGKYAGRVVFDNAPASLTPDEQRAMMIYIAKRALTTDTQVKWNTIPKARRELEMIERERAAGAKKWAHASDSEIRMIKLYYTALEKELQAYLPKAPANDQARTDAPKTDAPKPPKFG